MSRHVRVFSSCDEFLVRDKEAVPKYGVGHCTPKTMNAAGFYLMFILTSILNTNFLAQTISEMNTE